MRANMILLAAALAVSSAGAQAPAKDDLKALKYTELGQRVRDQRGKVVVVYFWSGT